MRTLTYLFGLTLSATAGAQISPDSPLVQALREGRATAALPESQGARLVSTKIQQQTGTQGSVTLEFERIARFTSQPRCGRVGYAPYQKSSNTYWPQFGGQINICDDGTPPLRSCKGSSILTPANSLCEDGSRPENTAEIRQAITSAVASGGLTAEQFRVQPLPRPATAGDLK